MQTYAGWSWICPVRGALVTALNVFGLVAGGLMVGGLLVCCGQSDFMSVERVKSSDTANYYYTEAVQNFVVQLSYRRVHYGSIFCPSLDRALTVLDKRLFFVMKVT